MNFNGGWKSHAMCWKMETVSVFLLSILPWETVSHLSCEQSLADATKLAPCLAIVTALCGGYLLIMDRSELPSLGYMIQSAVRYTNTITTHRRKMFLFTIKVDICIFNKLVYQYSQKMLKTTLNKWQMCIVHILHIKCIHKIKLEKYPY